MTGNETKMVIILDPSKDKGELANRSAVLCTGITKLFPGIIGNDLITKDNKKINAITALPIPILAIKEELNIIELAKLAYEKQCTTIVYLMEAQGLRSYKEYSDIVSSKNFDDLNIDSLLIYGPKKAVNSLTGSLPRL